MNFEQLPFVAMVDGRVHAWSPKRSGEYQVDCACGRLYFEQLQAAMVASDNTLLLSQVLQAQVSGGRWEGVEIGFAQAMAEAVTG